MINSIRHEEIGGGYTMQRKITLSAADLTTIDLSRAGLKGSPTKVKKTFVPKKKTGGVTINEEDAAGSAKRLFGLLSEANII